ncbi:hypothetical protein [Thalassoglobus neptunius]|nr:hypothetical protein [Thalassoglobus neptunius]
MNAPNNNRPKQYRSKLPAADKNGDVRPRIGGKRFTVGNTQSVSFGEMERRRDALKTLFANQCEELGIDFWANWILPFAKQIERGERVTYKVRSPSKVDDACGQGFALEDATVLSRLRRLGVEVEADDEAAITRGENQLTKTLDERITKLVTALIESERENAAFGLDESLIEKLNGHGPPPNADAETRTFHQAIKAYQQNIKKTGKRYENGKLARSPKNYLRWSRLIMEAHDDFPMWRLDRDKLDELLAYYRNRPVSPKTGKPIGYDDAKHKLDCLWSIVNWISDSERWNWSRPKGKFDRKPNRTASDRRKNATRRVSKGTYTPEQLAIIVPHLDTLGKAMLAIGVNCGMQASELGRLEINNYLTVHPETEEQNDWIIIDREKTGEYGEWILWPETAGLVRWSINRAKRIGTEILWVTEDGVPLYRESWENPETRIAKWWQAIPSKSDSHEGVVTRLSRTIDGFPRLTFKTIRKILPNMARPKHGAEVADLLNARSVDGSGTSGGRITDRYADRLYDEAKEAIQSLESNFRPFLNALAEDPATQEWAEKRIEDAH